MLNLLLVQIALQMRTGFADEAFEGFDVRNKIGVFHPPSMPNLAPSRNCSVPDLTTFLFTKLDRPTVKPRFGRFK